MSEKPLDRLNYYNGQRLEARDLKLEQEYHIRVRHWLNKSLYTPGIARGLDVRPETNESGQNTLTVLVGPGLALDAEGHEIILLEEERVPVVGKGSMVDGDVEGNYLVIQYREQALAVEQGGCAVRSPGCEEPASRLAWSGPTKLRAKPILTWTDVFPFETSGQIVLGQVELDAGCTKVRRVHVGVRRYAGAASAAKVRQYALEGEREVAFIPKTSFPAPANADVRVVERVYFHIRGRQPNAVALYLKAEELSLLHYTELGDHTHDVSVSGGTGPADPSLGPAATKHYHGSGTLAADLIARKGYYGDTTNQNTGAAGFVLIENGHWIMPEAVLAGTGVQVPGATESILDDVDGKISMGGNTEEWPGFSYSHTHKLSGTGGTGHAGTADATQPLKVARTGKPLDYVEELQVYIDGTDETHNQTNNILTQLGAANPADWASKKLGDGTKDHPLVTMGTGPIKLDFLPNVNFTEGEHWIELRAKEISGKPNGGRILYNLYVE